MVSLLDFSFKTGYFKRLAKRICANIAQISRGGFIVKNYVKMKFDNHVPNYSDDLIAYRWQAKEELDQLRIRRNSF